MCFFCFKQKTAYEMRISDWSSDVCSSDLDPGARGQQAGHEGCARRQAERARRVAASEAQRPLGERLQARRVQEIGRPVGTKRPAHLVHHEYQDVGPPAHRGSPPRSEEHTSELQSLMRISYAVFCLKKKNQK